ncbi:poly(A) RNA polymerase gld-2 homolog A-like isoform X2 [Artemia franciscana]|uniref:poly(A) RNA polymerase gld-2 homolog A-like isoform X2 n=1 Tax=Artemia franciscana TaxID=6661 RepID=UPI0032DA3EFD
MTSKLWITKLCLAPEHNLLALCLKFCCIASSRSIKSSKNLIHQDRQKNFKKLKGRTNKNKQMDLRVGQVAFNNVQFDARYGFRANFVEGWNSLQHPVRRSYEEICYNEDFCEATAKYLGLPSQVHIAPTDKVFICQLSLSIWTKFKSIQQSPELLAKKMKIQDSVARLIKRPHYGLYIVGSTFSGFGCKVSDLDMCLIIPPIFESFNYKFSIIEVLRGIKYALDRMPDRYEKIELIDKAKVPILKFCDRESGVYVDLSINCDVGLRNTHLLHSYARDWRVRPLAVIVKLWAKFQGINDARSTTLSSYALSLMVIHYLQCGTSPRVLPCLQQMYDRNFHPNVALGRLKPLTEYELNRFCSKNQESIGDLFLGFLDYYANRFNFRDHCMSVRLGGKIPVKDLNTEWNYDNYYGSEWKFISIEEPFDRSNVGRTVYGLEGFEKIMNVFTDSYKKLKETRELSSVLR